MELLPRFSRFRCRYCVSSCCALYMSAANGRGKCRLRHTYWMLKCLLCDDNSVFIEYWCVNGFSVSVVVQQTTMLFDKIRTKQLIPELEGKGDLVIFLNRSYREVAVVIVVKGTSRIRRNTEEFSFSWKPYSSNELIIHRPLPLERENQPEIKLPAWINSDCKLRDTHLYT